MSTEFQAPRDREEIKNLLFEKVLVCYSLAHVTNGFPVLHLDTTEPLHVPVWLKVFDATELDLQTLQKEIEILQKALKTSMN